MRCAQKESRKAKADKTHPLGSVMIKAGCSPTAVSGTLVETRTVDQATVTSDKRLILTAGQTLDVVLE